MEKGTGLVDPHHPRPWTRFLARWIDLQVTGLAVGFLIGLTYPGILAWGVAGSLVIGLLVSAGHVAVESVLMALSGYTFGKWLLRIQVFRPDGERLPMGMALGRAWEVWWRGMGLGIPFLNLVTMTAARKRLEQGGRTVWDERLGLQVSHGTIGPVRTVVAMLFVVAVLATGLWGPYRDGRAHNLAAFRQYEGDGFSIRLPSEPTIESEAVPGVPGTKAVMYLSQQGTVSYVVVVAPMPVDVTRTTAETDPVLDAGRDNMLRKTNGTLVSEKRLTHQGYSARQVEVKVAAEDLLVTFRIIVTPDRVWILGVGQLVGENRDLPIEAYFQSFVIK